MKTKVQKSLLYVVTCVILCLAVALLFYLTYCYAEYCCENNVDFSVGIGQLINSNPGDFLWGTAGIMLTFASSLLLIVTFNQQRKQFEEQYKTEYATRFENTFFNLMTMFYNVRASVNQNIKLEMEIGKGERRTINNIEEYSNTFISAYKNDEDVIRICSDLSKENITDTEIENIKYSLGNYFKVYNAEFGNPLSYYFRYLYNLINYVIDYWKDNRAQIDKYLKFMQAQMSDAELSLLFYNCLSKDSKDSQYQYTFFSKINDLNFLQNINENCLLDRSNHLLYDKTRFRFLNRDELEKKKSKLNNKK